MAFHSTKEQGVQSLRSAFERSSSTMEGVPRGGGWWSKCSEQLAAATGRGSAERDLI